MGTWSHGNFDDDTAADHLAGLVGRLLDEVAQAIADPAELEPDEYWGVAVPCNLEIVSLFAAQRWTGVELPEPSVVRGWKATYMAVWDEHIDGLEPKPGFKAQRRKTLQRTFDALIAHSERSHAGSEPAMRATLTKPARARPAPGAKPGKPTRARPAPGAKPGKPTRARAAPGAKPGKPTRARPAPGAKPGKPTRARSTPGAKPARAGTATARARR